MANGLNKFYFCFLNLVLLSIFVHRTTCKSLEVILPDQNSTTEITSYNESSWPEIILNAGTFYLGLIDFEKSFQGSNERGLDLQYISTATKIIVKALWNKIYKCYSPHFLLDLIINEYNEYTGTFLTSTMNMFKKSFQCVYKEAVDMMAALSN